MRTFRLRKVVRSKIPQLMERAGSAVVGHDLTGEDAYQALLDKVIEEATEAKLAPPEHRAKELADLRAAVQGAELVGGVAQTAIAAAKADQTAKKGDFSKVFYIDTVSVQDDDPMAEYYASDPERYPEVRE